MHNFTLPGPATAAAAAAGLFVLKAVNVWGIFMSLIKMSLKAPTWLDYVILVVTFLTGVGSVTAGWRKNLRAGFVCAFFSCIFWGLAKYHNSLVLMGISLSLGTVMLLLNLYVLVFDGVHCYTNAETNQHDGLEMPVVENQQNQQRGQSWKINKTSRRGQWWNKL